MEVNDMTEGAATLKKMNKAKVSKRIFAGFLIILIFSSCLCGISVDAADAALNRESGIQSMENEDSAGVSTDDKNSDTENRGDGTDDVNSGNKDSGGEGTGDADSDNGENGGEVTGDADSGNGNNGGEGTGDADSGNEDNGGDGADDENKDTVSENDKDDESTEVGGVSADINWENCQYVMFAENKDNIEYSIPDGEAVMAIEHEAPSTVYQAALTEDKELTFEAAVGYAFALKIPKKLQSMIKPKQERRSENGRWIYGYTLDLSAVMTTREEPLVISLIRDEELAVIEVSGDAYVNGIDENGMARIGSAVTIEVLNAGDTLALIEEDEKGNTVYTAMELDYGNRYTFEVKEGLSFVVTNPDEADYAIAYSDSRRAKLTGEAGLKLKALTSSAQGCSEIVLNFTAVLNGSDGTETEDVYYEVKVTAAPGKEETVPAGSEGTKYYYIRKTENSNTQSKSIVVNSGNPLEITGCTYEFSVRLVQIDKTLPVPSGGAYVEAPLNAVLSGNTITKKFATKSLYYEDKLGFTKKNTKIYTGQSDLLAGMVKYSKKASCLHDLTAIVYNEGGGACESITCYFKNDNDELYVSADRHTKPGKYTVVVYASIGEAQTKDSPQSGSMYQANTSFVLTVEPGINYINTYAIVRQISVADKNITFSAAPVGFGGYNYDKARKQQFTYEIKSAIKDKADRPASGDDSDAGLRIIEPTRKVQNSISISKNGKVTIKKGYTVDADTGEDYIAVIIKAADFEGNPVSETVYIRILNTVLVPTQIYLENDKGQNLGTRFSADMANYYSIANTRVSAKVVVLDQFGNNMNRYVTITPGSNGKSNRNYVWHSANSADATLYIYKMGAINIKAVSTDGGRKSKTVRFNVTAPESTHTLYKLSDITYNGGSIYDYKTQTGLVTYSAPKGSVIKFYQGAEINRNDHTDHSSDKKSCRGLFGRSWYNWKYEVKGGKLKFDGDLWVLTPTQKTATVIIWPKSNSRNRTRLNFTNNSWSTNYDKAPGIRLTSGKIYSNGYCREGDAIKDVGEDEDGTRVEYSYPPDQQLTYQYDSGMYGNAEIKAVSKKAPYFWLSDFNGADRTFKLNASSGNVKPGSYKYRITFYNIKSNSKGSVKSIAAQNTTITVKVYKASKIKIAPSYTLKTEQADSIGLKCTPSGFMPDFDVKVLNANINGRTNDFSDYFELTMSTDAVGVRRASVKFKEAVTAEQKSALKGKTLTGYVRYRYYYGNDHIENATSKITIKIK